MSRVLDAAVDGALAGAIATIPMSAMMYVAHQGGWLDDYPPEVITEKTLDAVGGHPDIQAAYASATVTHLAFGAGGGALFGLLQRRMRLRASPVVQGIGYGLLVYAVSYDGWIPALHFLPAPGDDVPGRQASMIAAHVVYGAVLGALLGRSGSR